MAKKNKTDERTLELIREVNKRKAEIISLERPNYKTNCSFSYDENKLNGAINIHVETNLKNLINMVAFLQSKQEAYRQAATTLEVVNPPEFTWNGFNVADWISDIKTRISKIQIAEKKKLLQKLEDRLNLIVSPELRAEMELEAIAAELK